MTADVAQNVRLMTALADLSPLTSATMMMRTYQRFEGDGFIHIRNTPSAPAAVVRVSALFLLLFFFYLFLLRPQAPFHLFSVPLSIPVQLTLVLSLFALKSEWADYAAAQA